MEDFYIPATAMSPEIDFRFSCHVLNIRGESYPENAAAFYGEILNQLARYLGSEGRKKIEVNVELRYFNSSSTKILLRLFEMLNDAVSAGNEITLNWYHDEEDDTILEFGEDLHSDYELLDFNPIAISEA
ncbi:MAG TPA: DUF1987 domain-containing protein [Burkholderiales bacterium]|nr:DUF1987 domain-containing protein [Burkholderiales bacterium]